MKPKPKWKLIGDYPVVQYKCGVRAGQLVRLKRDVVVTYKDGTPTGDMFRAGEVWKVLPGAAEPPVVVWLLPPDGNRSTWDDDASFYDDFEVLPDELRKM